MTPFLLSFFLREDYTAAFTTKAASLVLSAVLIVSIRLSYVNII